MGFRGLFRKRKKADQSVSKSNENARCAECARFIGNDHRKLDGKIYCQECCAGKAAAQTASTSAAPVKCRAPVSAEGNYSDSIQRRVEEDPLIISGKGPMLSPRESLDTSMQQPWMHQPDGEPVIREVIIEEGIKTTAHRDSDCFSEKSFITLPDDRLQEHFRMKSQPDRKTLIRRLPSRVIAVSSSLGNPYDIHHRTLCLFAPSESEKHCLLLLRTETEDLTADFEEPLRICISEKEIYIPKQEYDWPDEQLIQKYKHAFQ